MPPFTRVQHMVEDARIMHKNFQGKESDYNAKGSRNFSLVLPPDLLTQMQTEFNEYGDTWNFKETKPREDGDEVLPFLPIQIGFNGPRPPKIMAITSAGMLPMDESLVGTLDWQDFTNVDVKFQASDWQNKMGNHGRKAYLVSLYVTVDEDELDKKYANIPILGQPVEAPPELAGDFENE